MFNSAMRRSMTIVTATAAAALLLAGCAGQTAASDENGNTKITLTSQPNGAGLPFFIAEKEGYFADEGLAVTVANYASGAASLAAGAAGEWQAGWLGAPPALTGANSFGLIPVGLMMREDANHIMFMNADVLEGSTPKEVLESHPVATQQNALSEQVMRACAEYLGVPSKDVQLVPLEGGAVSQALISGQVDVANSWATPSWPLLQEPDKFTPVCNGEEAGVAVTSPLVVTPAFLSDDPEAAASFIRAATRATEFINENPDKAVDYMVDYYKTYAIAGDREQAQYEVEIRDWFTLDESIESTESGQTADALKASAQFFVDAGVYPQAPPIDDLLETGLELMKNAQAGEAE
jgi:ABC-type nitrate/sulfonate/bicarbonate transport systems, periplasmic components